MGSLPRPPDIREMLLAKDAGEPYDKDLLARRVKEEVAAVVKKQVEVGIDIVADGEISKGSFTNYMKDRLSGFEAVESEPWPGPPDDFPEFAEISRRYGRAGPIGGVGLGSGSATAATAAPPPGRSPVAAQIGTLPRNIGPIGWKDERGELETDLANLKEALTGLQYEEAFMPSVAVGQVIFMIRSAHYKSDSEYLYALADAMKLEYEAIVNAGFLLQLDAPDVPMMRNRQLWQIPFEDYRKHLALRVEALNHALQNIPEDRIRFHICWGNTYGTHHRDVPLKDIVDIVLQVKAQAYTIEAANPRHEHEYEVWEDVKLPDGKILIPGVIDSVSLFIEPPELVAQRIIRYANIVGRENVIAAPDCGFGTFAGFLPRVHSEPMWEKLRAMVQGAQLASKRLWAK
ncbi:MAG TPA: cobalamin-independent methionine synthase II family protein [Dehalococcoidia bacterium]|nr:cobalamin-independent methionine synthase II family protein [Dehalococcoidia bacterium]